MDVDRLDPLELQILLRLRAELDSASVRLELARLRLDSFGVATARRRGIEGEAQIDVDPLRVPELLA